MFEQLQKLISHNDFLSGGLLLAVTGTIFAYLRKLPRYLWQQIESRFTTTIYLDSTDPLFNWLKIWLANHPYSKRVGILSACSTQIEKALKERGLRRPNVMLTPAPGCHWMWYQNYLIAVYRRRDEKAGKDGTITIHETISLQLYTRNREVAKRLLIEARDLAIPPDDTGIQIYASGESYRGDGWQALTRISSREPNSLIMAEGLLEGLIEKIQLFLDSKERYERLGIPYHMGILFQGPPGNGKSSAIRAIASYFNFNLCLLNFKEDSRHLSNLFKLFGQLPKQSLLVVEDVDRDRTVTIERSKDDEPTYNNDLGAILNLMDGLLTPDGMILIMTANHPERLDPAFVRPGRIDHVIEVTNADLDMAERLFNKFYPDEDSSDFLEMVDMMEEAPSMAKLQSLLLTAQESPIGVIR